MGTLKSFRELIIWKKSMDLAEQIYRVTEKFPKNELFGLISQMRRAAVSIPSNIAEGQSRNSRGEFLQFLGVARGSMAELDTQIELSGRLGFLTKEEEKTLNLRIEEISKMLSGLKRSLPL
ncbi:four helix bundle protein [Candidatus Sumerlaeota bacterium]|nr:four helix bundle protein [Candidatus Sumerlaeota bacterium]